MKKEMKSFSLQGTDVFKDKIIVLFVQYFFHISNVLWTVLDPSDGGEEWKEPESN